MERQHNNHPEKRLHPRVDANFTFKLKSGELIVPAEAINLSVNGVYCKTGKPIPLMTSLNIVLTLLHEDMPDELTYVECCGVVVRSDKMQNGYHIAIFFNEIDEPEKKKLIHFIDKCLSINKESPVKRIDGKNKRGKKNEPARQ